jgi:BirA family biotin operon repressor/biotin-[acetyl-CoA-carboxylase] ligase
MLSEEALRTALRSAGLDAPVRFEEVTDSTNTTALAMAEDGAPQWTLVAAGHQTAGRGRLGRTWVSEPEGALLFSVVLRPTLSPARAGLLTLLAGACMAEACRDACGVQTACKWPNDLLMDGGKAGGILAEAKVMEGRIQHVVLGIGVNLADPPVGVEGAAGLGGCDGGRLLGEFLRRFRERYRPEDPAFPESVLAAYRPVAATLGRRVRATTVDGRVVEGTASDLDVGGDLIVETEEGRHAVAFGEVLHLET